jgi:hypothetical protein
VVEKHAAALVSRLSKSAEDVSSNPTCWTAIDHLHLVRVLLQRQPALPRPSNWQELQRYQMP